MKTKAIQVPVKFEGVVTVCVPAHLNKDDAQLLAEKYALSRILATVDLKHNPDAPDDMAFDEYEDECSEKAKRTAEKDFDATTDNGVGGEWGIGSMGSRRQ